MQKSNFRPYGRGMLKASALFLTVVLCFSSCKQGSDQESKPAASNKTAASTSVAQPKPGGKIHFSTSIGRFATTGTIWVRMLNLTFNDAAGTVSGYYWQWDSVAEKGKTALSTHTCSLGGAAPKTCTIYTPTGWITPGSQWVYIEGTYTYNAGALHIDWLGPHTGDSENWTVTNPIATIARLSFVSSAGTGYQITHGTGYGSNRARTDANGVPQPGVHFVNIGDIPRVVYTGKYILYNRVTDPGEAPVHIWEPAANGASGGWKNNTLDLSTANTPSNPSPATAYHFYTPQAGGAGCYGSPKTGHIYHLEGKNNGRSMAYSHFKACLSHSQTPSPWPCYNDRMHPYAFNQIIDDNGAFKGFIGIEQQDQSPSPTTLEYQLVDYTLIP